MAPEGMVRTCSIWRALEVTGDTPTLLILEASFLGVRRFDDFGRTTGIHKVLLSGRLKQLVNSGLMEKRAYAESPTRFAYRLTEKGQAIYPVALMLLRWERKWNRAPGKIKVTLAHRRCGHRFQPVPACARCGEAIDPKAVSAKDGPGLGWMMPGYRRRRQLRASSHRGTSLFEDVAQLMGDRWASLILRSMFMGFRRFDELYRDLGIATNMLAERLAWLTRFGMIRQRQYASFPDRFEYRFTRKGVDFYPALLMLMQWGDRHVAAPEGPPLLLVHRSCRRPLVGVAICSHCREPLVAPEVRFAITVAIGQRRAG